MLSEAEIDQRKHAMAVVATAADAAIAAAQAAADVISLTSTTGKTSSAAIKIQAAFRSYLVLPLPLSSL